MVLWTILAYLHMDEHLYQTSAVCIRGFGGRNISNSILEQFVEQEVGKLRYRGFEEAAVQLQTRSRGTHALSFRTKDGKDSGSAGAVAQELPGIT